MVWNGYEKKLAAVRQAALRHRNNPKISSRLFPQLPFFRSRQAILLSNCTFESSAGNMICFNRIDILVMLSNCILTFLREEACFLLSSFLCPNLSLNTPNYYTGYCPQYPLPETFVQDRRKNCCMSDGRPLF